MASAPSLAGSYHASCASNEEESSFLQRIRLLHWVRLGLSFLALGISVSIIACEVVPYRHYRHTSSFESVGLYLWPLNLDLRPTIAILACGCVIAFLSVVFIIVALLPSPHSHIRRVNLAAVTTSAAGFIASLVGLVFAIYLPGSSYPADFDGVETLHSWTCKWKVSHNLPLGFSDAANETVSPAPANFARDCSATCAAFVLLGFLIGLEVIMGVAAGLGTWLELSVARQRAHDQYQLEKVGTTFKYGR
ncbi:hypothetical protein ASPSYDRAFT_138532 [Aspergillus sydowii CBS 593.65]|uniref:MARVEL domain-containing protein n=1 Tax=Aspergillus sydowii CBS 593.65 TaxID=1036612 RepID=A0A1L9TWE9_9EURO|nr:uncharacterized protein ASPSYDRAFT_138532 [Aspergillus sydowii CBS 593.65]OJJ63761.1 hypothetical protein ASPSYDRAFT_138532 [Aspergillus sydowii CBS 593.65]